MKSFTLSALLLCLPLTTAHAASHRAAPTERVFFSRQEIEVDAATRISRSAGVSGKLATMPGSSNYVKVEGDVVIPYGFAFSITVPGDATRFECASVLAGCGSLANADHLLVYGHMGGAVGCFDGPSPVAWVNLIYRRTATTCGGQPCQVWVLLSQ